MGDTLTKVVNTVRLFAQERSGTTYSSLDDGCYYDAGTCSDGSVGCIVGQALQANGIDNHLGCCDAREALEKLKIVRFSSSEEGEVRGTLWLVGVQRLQDRGFSWGDAVKAADHVFETQPLETLRNVLNAYLDDAVEKLSLTRSN